MLHFDFQTEKQQQCTNLYRIYTEFIEVLDLSRIRDPNRDIRI